MKLSEKKISHKISHAPRQRTRGGKGRLKGIQPEGKYIKEGGNKPKTKQRNEKFFSPFILYYYFPELSAASRIVQPGTLNH
jgi:hypothetical protein